MIPVWGSGRPAMNDFQNRRWGWGLFNTAMAISDLFMVRAAFKAGSKLLVKGAGETAGDPRWAGRDKNLSCKVIRNCQDAR